MTLTVDLTCVAAMVLLQRFLSRLQSAVAVLVLSIIASVWPDLAVHSTGLGQGAEVRITLPRAS